MFGEGAKFAAYCSADRRRIAVGPNNQRHAAKGHLKIGFVGLQGTRPSQTILLDIADDSNDLSELLWTLCDIYALANRVFIREVLLGHRLVYRLQRYRRA